MTLTALTGAAIFTGDIWLNSGHAVLLDGHRITAIVADDEIPQDCAREKISGMTLVPGFIDTQVNGGGGVLFNDAPTVETIRKIGQAHRVFGTTGFLPTLISDDLKKVDAAIDAVQSALDAGVPGIIGIHIEGPFLNAAKKGVHDASKFKSLTADHVKRLTRLRGGKTLITLAPEKASPVLITQLVKQGAIVSAGHTNASYAQTLSALEAGMAGFTHLFNAMSQISSREPGVVGAALDHQDSYCGLIVDGCHVANANLRLALRSKSIDRFMLVSDAMPTVGMRDKRFDLQGRSISVQNGVCIAEDGTLAGSDLDMATAVRNTQSMLGIERGDAINLASGNPAAFLGLSARKGKIAAGYDADLVAFDQKGTVTNTWIEGFRSE